ncbi:unnamed protein product [Staurois parvus]|uniref:Uncharacterized protein n=1 Tax=Staurois parvus TaxID=386267 RepID=A0ABN9GUK8_9NEOB|nr:unnamed protein product [Staurois parvus]
MVQHCPHRLFYPAPASLLWAPGSGCPLHMRGSLLGPVTCPQSLVIPYTVSAVSGHPLYCVRSLWSSPVLCPQSLVIFCTMSAVSGHLLYHVRSLWSSPVPCPQSLVISCSMSAVSGHFLYYCCSPLVQDIFFLVFLP